jgi:hypothetical protein
LVFPVCPADKQVVKTAWTIDADPHKEIIFWKNSHHSSFKRVPLVCRMFSKIIPGFRYFSWKIMAFLKKSIPIKVGSPPCQETVTR